MVFSFLQTNKAHQFYFRRWRVEKRDLRAVESLQSQKRRKKRQKTRQKEETAMTISDVRRIGEQIGTRAGEMSERKGLRATETDSTALTVCTANTANKRIFEKIASLKDGP